MNVEAFVLCCLFGGIAVCISVVLERRRVTRAANILKALASRHHGARHRYVNMLSGGSSYTIIPCHGRDMVVVLGYKHPMSMEHGTAISVPVDTHHTLTSFRSGGRGVASGYKDYDDRFVVESSSPDWAKRFFALHHEIRRRHLENDALTISIREGKLTLYHLDAVWDRRQLDELVVLAFSIVKWVPNIPTTQSGEERKGSLSLARDDASAGGLTVSKAGGGELSSVDS